MCHLSGSRHPSSPVPPSYIYFLSLALSSSFLCLLSSTVPLSAFIYIYTISFPFLASLNLALSLSLPSSLSSLPCFLPSSLRVSPSSPGMCHLSGSRHPSLSPPPLLYILPLSCTSHPLSFCLLSSYCPSFCLYIHLYYLFSFPGFFEPCSLSLSPFLSLSSFPCFLPSS